MKLDKDAKALILYIVGFSMICIPTILLVCSFMSLGVADVNMMLLGTLVWLAGILLFGYANEAWGVENV